MVEHKSPFRRTYPLRPSHLFYIWSLLLTSLVPGEPTTLRHPLLSVDKDQKFENTLPISETGIADPNFGFLSNQPRFSESRSFSRAFTLVQQVNDGWRYPSTGQPTLTTSKRVTKGNLLIAWVSSQNPSFQTIADSTNNWIKLYSLSTGGYGKISVWYCISQRDQTLSVKFFDATITPTGGFGSVPNDLKFSASQLMEFSGASLNPSDAAATFTTGASRKLSTTLRASANGLIVGVMIPATGGQPIAGSAFTPINKGYSPAEYKTVLGAGTYTVSMLQNLSAPWGLLAMSFAPPASRYTISGSLGAAGAGAEVLFVSTTTVATQRVTADRTGNYTSPVLDNDCYWVQPQLVGQTFSPLRSIVTLSGANSSGNNFTPSSVNTKLTLTTQVADTFKYANVDSVNPLNWPQDGNQVPPWDNTFQIISNKAVLRNTTIVNNYAGPFCASGMSVNQAITWPSNQFAQVQIDALNSTSLSYALAQVLLKTTTTLASGVMLTILNNGDGTVSVRASGTDSSGAGHPSGSGNYPLNQLGSRIGPGFFNKVVNFAPGDAFALANVGSTFYALHNGTIIGNWVDMSTFAGGNIGGGLLMTGNALTDVEFSNFAGGRAGVLSHHPSKQITRLLYP